jgi:beta-galactosidase
MADTGTPLEWRARAEPLPGAEANRAAGFAPVRLPHNMLLQTRDETDFGWYRAEVGSPRARTVELRARVGDLLSVWVNGEFAGAAPDRLKEDRTRASDFDVSLRVPLRRGRNALLLLVNAIGLIKGDWMIGAPQTRERKGLLSAVTLDGKPVAGPWEFAAGLWGERARLHDPSTTGAAWRKRPGLPGPLRWFRASFTLARRDLGDERPWAIDVGGLQKGFLWVNGQCLGRYWQVPAIDAAYARYTNHPHLVNTGHDRPVQRYYHIPPDWLRAGENVVVVLEERGARPDTVRIVRREAEPA